MQAASILGEAVEVALRKESVDRNRYAGFSAIGALSRSPQGERG